MKSPPDGYMLLMSTASLAVNVTLYPKMPFDVRKDLIAIDAGRFGADRAVACTRRCRRAT